MDVSSEQEHDPSVLSPLQLKAVLIFESIKTRQVLSNREITFQALEQLLEMGGRLKSHTKLQIYHLVVGLKFFTRNDQQVPK